MQTEPSFHHFHVQHYCPVAQTLERLGDRWSWLIVRDLMRGPQRFTDLQRYLAGITPKRLTVNLRALESEGIVEREREPGRREVWYRLTAKGQGLVHGRSITRGRAGAGACGLQSSRGSRFGCGRCVCGAGAVYDVGPPIAPERGQEREGQDRRLRRRARRGYRPEARSDPGSDRPEGL